MRINVIESSRTKKSCRTKNYPSAPLRGACSPRPAAWGWGLGRWAEESNTPASCTVRARYPPRHAEHTTLETQPSHTALVRPPSHTAARRGRAPSALLRGFRLLSSHSASSVEISSSLSTAAERLRECKCVLAICYLPISLLISYTIVCFLAISTESFFVCTITLLTLFS